MTIFINFFRRMTRRWARSDVTVILGLTAFMVLVGTFGFARFEGWSRTEAFYATIITVTTVGYGDYSPVTPAGRTFAIFFTTTAIGIVGYAISTFAAYLVEGRAAKKAKFLRKRRMKRIDALNQHIIVCGADLVGLRIAEEFYLRKVPFVLIDSDEAKLKKALLHSHPDYLERKIQSLMEIVQVDLSEYEQMTLPAIAEMLDQAYILEDATNDDALVRAGIGRATGVITALEDDRDNLSVVVGAKALAERFNNPTIRIMARVNDLMNMRKMFLAGAHMVRMPAVSSGLEMASHMQHPELGEWWYEMMGVDKLSAPALTQVNIVAGHDWIGRTITAIHQQFDTVALALKRDGAFQSPPSAETIVQVNDILITIAHNA